MLNTKRIGKLCFLSATIGSDFVLGHGLALKDHPILMQMMVQQNIAVEVRLNLKQR